MDRLATIAARHRLTVVEDCAHAIEAEVRGRRTGTFGDFGCFSFYATKNLTTGEGGMVLTADVEAAARIRTLALHGMTKDAWKRFSDEGYRHYMAVESGWKFNMMDLQAALGIHQLRRVGRALAERRRQWHAYLHDLADLPVGLPCAEARHGVHARHLFTLRVGARSPLSRDQLMSALHERGVGTGVHYLSVLDHPAFDGAGHAPTPNAQRIGRETLSIPLGGALTEEQRLRVVAALRQALGA
jgi:dTDP-4-amino-4,6-dideoxygalactose transaminase